MRQRPGGMRGGCGIMKENEQEQTIGTEESQGDVLLREIPADELEKVLEEHRKWGKSYGEEGMRADLSGAHLSEARLPHADLHEANLSEGNLSHAMLFRADLTMANLIKANLSGAHLIKASLIGAHLSNANLSGAHLSEANLNKADLIKADLIGADLIGADLCVTNLSGADLRQAILRQANLSEANLSGANLWGANLIETNLSKANLSKANLSEADLSKASLREANLSEADLSKTNLSEAIVDKATLQFTRKIVGGQVGVNGIWSEETDTAALMTLTPSGNSMQGSNPEAVVESLKRARKLHGFSMGLTGLVLLIVILRLQTIKPTFFEEHISIERFGFLAMLISIGILSMVIILLSDALNGTRFLNDRKSAMTVGNFPWLISRYSHGSLWDKYLSLIIRLIMIFHPVVYLYYYGRFNIFGVDTWNRVTFILFLTILLAICIWTFVISQRFQKPILFDARTEKQRRSDLNELTEAVKEQTTSINELIGILKPKQSEKPSDRQQEKED